jgi:Uma2 family endonuclease
VRVRFGFGSSGLGDIAMAHASVVERALSRKEVVGRYLALDRDTRFRDFAGKIEVNEYGDLLVNAASRIHVVVQKRLGSYLERQLGGEAITEMPVEVVVTGTKAIKVRVPDISWSSLPGFFDGPPEVKILRRPAELCIEIKSDGNTLKDLRDKRDELLAAGAKEVGFIFPERRRAEFFGIEGLRRKSEFNVDLKDFWLEY